MELLPAAGRRLAGVALVATAILAATACSGPAASTPASVQSVTAPAAMPSMAAMDAGMAMASSSGADAAPAAATVHVTGSALSDPGPVRAGAKVTVMNMDREAHTVLADDGSFTVTAAPGQSVSFTAPAKPGVYPYHCQGHSDLQAALTVK